MGRQTFFFPRSISDMCPRSMPNRCAISTGDHFFRSRSFRILWPNRVSRDDTLWIVTVRNYRLKLLGHIVADKIVGQRAAERRFREKLYKAKFHVLARKGNVEKLHEIDIHRLAPRLRFESKNDRFRLGPGGHINGQQLQSLRELTQTSADLLASNQTERRSRDTAGSERSLNFPVTGKFLQTLCVQPYI